MALFIFKTLALDRSGQIKAPGRLSSKMDSAPNAQEAGWAKGPFGIGAENLSATGVRIPKLPVFSESLHRLSYPDPAFTWWNDEKPRKICSDGQ